MSSGPGPCKLKISRSLFLGRLCSVRRFGVCWAFVGGKERAAVKKVHEEAVKEVAAQTAAGGCSAAECEAGLALVATAYLQ